MLLNQPTFERIALNRITFGARDLDIEAVQRMGWAPWVEDQLNPPAGDDSALDQYLRSRTLHIEYAASDTEFQKWPALKEDRPLQYLWIGAKEMWRLNHEVLFKKAYPEQSRPFDELASSVYIRNTHSRYQLREVMTDFWLNHFSVSQYKSSEVRDSILIYDRDVVRPNALGNFRQMLQGIATSATMLKYLDNADSNAQHPNENYARELMELHTMGRPVYYGKNTSGADVSAIGFTDEDVVQASRALSGWTINQGWYSVDGQTLNTGEFYFNPYQHNENAGVFLGVDLSTMKGVAQGTKVLDLLAAHPATAAYVTGKICRHLFGENPPPAVLARAATAWTANRDKPDQIKQVLKAIIMDGPEIGTGPQVIVRRPHERMIALARAMDAKIQPSSQWTYLMNSLSDAPFGWATPDGRPDTNEFWLNSSTNVGIWNQLQYLTYVDYSAVDFIAQTPIEVADSATLTAEYWVGRIIGYRLNDEAMAALTNVVARMNEGYRGSQYYNAGFGIKFISVLATIPEFVYR